MTIYPEKFGGCYIDGAVLVVCLKDTDQKTVGRYTAFAGDAKQYIRIKKVRYSRNELQRIVDELAAVFRTKGYTWYVYGVDDMENAVRFGAKREDVNRMKREAAKRCPGVPCILEPGVPAILD